MRWDGSQDKAQQSAVVGSRARTRTERKTQDEATIRIPRSCDCNLSEYNAAIVTRIGPVKLLECSVQWFIGPTDGIIGSKHLK